MLKRMKVKIGTYFFRDYNAPGIFQQIISYIQDNKTCFAFSTVTKQIWVVFYEMLKKSSNRWYRLAVLNDDSSRIGKGEINIFDYTVREKYPVLKYKDYVQTKEKFLDFREKQQREKMTSVCKTLMRPGFSIDPFFKDLCKKRKKIISILANLNKRYGEVAFIAGGYALKMYMKNGVFENGAVDNEMDIDIFLLGGKKKNLELSKKFIQELSKEYPNELKMMIRNGMVDIFNQHLQPKTVAQLILRGHLETPNDLFSFFDLDCCKIGYFPGTGKVICSIDFIRALSTGKNKEYFKRLHFTTKKRVFKYYGRVKISTSKEHQPLFSFYHSHKKDGFKNLYSVLDTIDLVDGFPQEITKNPFDEVKQCYYHGFDVKKYWVLSKPVLIKDWETVWHLLQEKGNFLEYYKKVYWIMSFNGKYGYEPCPDENKENRHQIL